MSSPPTPAARRRRVIPLVVFGALLAAGLGLASGPAPVGAAPLVHLAPPAADRCDPIDPRHCLLPYPNDFFTAADPTTDTGRRVHLDPASMPVNIKGKAMDPAEWNQNDGFSPGSAVVLFAPGVDLGLSGAAPLTDIERSLDAAAPIVIIDAATGERHPYWSEVDAHAATDADRLLVVNPAVSFREGHRYIVAFRRLRDHANALLAPNEVFASYRKGTISDSAAVEARRPHMESLFGALASAGVARTDLYLAWDFTIASGRSLSERMLHIRDDAFASLAGAAPAFTVTNVQTDPDPRTARRISGTFEVPLYLNFSGNPGSWFAYGSDGLPRRTGTYQASFICTVPKVALGDGTTPVPARAVVYGHGLLGSNDEVDAGNIADMEQEHNMMYCATKWIGLSDEDILNAAHILQEMGSFKTLADRCQQGMLNTLFLGRLLKHADGFASDPAFQLHGTPVFDHTDIFYDGNSQGGIMGGAVTAVAQDWRRAVLGVPGMNYALLLPRSSDFEPFMPLIQSAYPDQLEQSLLLDLAQQLWDRAETNGYAQHLTRDPYPGTPTHQVMLHVALGDHQVTTYAAEVEARTIGARLRTPAVAPGRSPDVTPSWGLAPVRTWPTYGSIIEIWDSGSPLPPVSNLPPSSGHDPHEDPRRDATARRQKSQFLGRNGQADNVCGAVPCTAAQT
jgi:hypothetical protein